MLFTVAKSLVFPSVVIIANFCGIIFKRMAPDEYYLFSSRLTFLAHIGFVWFSQRQHVQYNQYCSIKLWHHYALPAAWFTAKLMSVFTNSNSTQYFWANSAKSTLNRKNIVIRQCFERRRFEEKLPASGSVEWRNRRPHPVSLVSLCVRPTNTNNDFIHVELHSLKTDVKLSYLDVTTRKENTQEAQLLLW